MQVLKININMQVFLKLIYVDQKIFLCPTRLFQKLNSCWIKEIYFLFSSAVNALILFICESNYENEIRIKINDVGALGSEMISIVKRGGHLSKVFVSVIYVAMALMDQRWSYIICNVFKYFIIWSSYNSWICSRGIRFSSYSQGSTVSVAL